MKKIGWNIGLIALLSFWTIGLVQFVDTTQRIRELADVGAPAGASHAPRAVLISQELDNPYWRAVEAGAREAAERNGWSLEYAGPRRIDPEEQIRLLEKAIASGADAVLLQGIGDPRYRELIDRAVRSGMLVVTVDADEPASARQAYVGTDNVEAGSAVGRLVAQASGGSGRIGVLIGDERAPNQAERLAGFREAIAGYPELSIVQVASTSISRLRAAAAAAAMLDAHPDIGYIAGFSSLDAIGALEALERDGSSTPRLFGFDDLPETLEGVRACGIIATVVQQPARMGRRAMELAHDGANGRALPEHTYTGVDVFDIGDAGGAEADCS